MTLIVSLRIPDGIVLAGDSLATMVAQSVLEANIETQCPHCGKKHNVQLKMPMPPAPATTFSYAQKVFPFLGRYGIGTFGAGMLAGKSIYYLIRQFEQRYIKSADPHPKSAREVATAVGEYVHQAFVRQIEMEKKKLSDLPDNGFATGFQVVGYDDEVAKTYEVQIGKRIATNEHADQAGCTVSGQQDVAKSIWSMYSNPTQQPAFDVFSLQDAIAYAKFLIGTTATHQQFSRTLPGVGGEIDIALITTFDGFEWIQKKELARQSTRSGK